MYASQNLRKFIRFLDRFPLVVKNISCDYNQIRILFINLFNHFLHLAHTDVVSKVRIRGQNDFDAFQISRSLINRNFVRGRSYDSGIYHPADRDRQNQSCAKTSRNPSHFRIAKFFSLDMQNVEQHQPHDIGDHYHKNHIKQHAEPIIAEQLHTSLHGAFRHQKCSQKRNRKKRIYGSRKHNPSSRPENRKACLQPARNTHEYVNVNDNIYRCQKKRCHIVPLCLSPCNMHNHTRFSGKNP